MTRVNNPVAVHLVDALAHAAEISEAFERLADLLDDALTQHVSTVQTLRDIHHPDGPDSDVQCPCCRVPWPCPTAEAVWSFAPGAAS